MVVIGHRVQVRTACAPGRCVVITLRILLMTVGFAAVAAARSWQVGIPIKDPGGSFLVTRVRRRSLCSSLSCRPRRESGRPVVTAQPVSVGTGPPSAADPPGRGGVPPYWRTTSSTSATTTSGAGTS